MDIRSEIESWFPNIVGKDFKIVKTNGDFNCVAFSLDGTNLFLKTEVDTKNKRLYITKIIQKYSLKCTVDLI